MKSQFLLNPEITYLNHGSFGACPRVIFDDYQKWQRELEFEPVQFILKNSIEYLQQSKVVLGGVIGCDPDDFFFTQNPTMAINTVMRSLNLKPGDEILATDHEYGAMDRTWNFYCKQSGAKYVRTPISLPIVSKEMLIEEFWKGYSANTKAIFINHISSATALIFPVKEICQRAKELGLITIIDGAHVPGHIPLNIASLDPDYYTGTCHKWMLTPKGSSFLYVKRALQHTLDPLVVSWGYESELPGKSLFLDYHEHLGTRDISAFLTIPAAIRFRDEYDLPSSSEACRQMILDNYLTMCSLVNSTPICPISSEFLGQMCSIPIKTSRPQQLKELLFDQHNIEIPIMKIDNRAFIRISLNAYNSQIDIEILSTALKTIIAETNLIEV